MESYIIQWAPEAERLFRKIIEEMPEKARPFLRQCVPKVAVGHTRLRNSDKVTVQDVIKGFEVGTPNRFKRPVKVAFKRRGIKLHTPHKL